MNDESPVAVAAISYSLPETMVIASKLRAYGIEAVVPDWHLLNCNPNLTTALGGLRIWVPQSDLAEALEIIGEAPPDEEKRNGRLSKSRSRHFMAAIAVWLLGLCPPARVRISLHKSARPR